MLTIGPHAFYMPSWLDEDLTTIMGPGATIESSKWQVGKKEKKKKVQIMFVFTYLHFIFLILFLVTQKWFFFLKLFHHDSFTFILHLNICTSHLSKNNKECALYGDKTSNNNIKGNNITTTTSNISIISHLKTTIFV